MWYLCVEMVQYNEFLISTLDSDDLVLKHQSTSCHRAERAPMRFQMFVFFCTHSVTYICVSKLTIVCSDAIIWTCHIANWTPRNKLQRNLNRNSYIFIRENTFENIVWKMAAILFRPQCVNCFPGDYMIQYRTDSRFAPSQWETSLQSNAVSHWMGANLESIV